MSDRKFTVAISQSIQRRIILISTVLLFLAATGFLRNCRAADSASAKLPQAVYRQDFNGDGRAEIADAPALARLIFHDRDNPALDYNRDGSTSARDIMSLILDLGRGRLSLATIGPGTRYPYRWAWVFGYSLDRDSDVEAIRAIADTAAAHGMNGLVLSANLDMLDLLDPDYFRRLKEVKAISDSLGLEIIPAAFSVGYGGGILSHNRNLAAGLPVKAEKFVVSGSVASPVADPPVGISNGDFESQSGGIFTGFSYLGQAATYMTVDTHDFHAGATALQINLPGLGNSTYASLKQTVKVGHYRNYRFKFWYKANNLNPEGGFSVQVLGDNGRTLTFLDGGLTIDKNWHELVLGFNSWSCDKVGISFGLSGSSNARIWIDDMSLEEAGLTNVLRRPGTPLTVKDAKTGVTYFEGVDYDYVRDPYLGNMRYEHPAPLIHITPGSSISNGDSLRVSFYHGMRSNPDAGQVTICMSEPEVYDIWRTQVRMLQDVLAPGKYLLNMDEIRAGGTCEACTSRGLTMGQILGDCLTKLDGIIREVNPRAEIFTWSDMLDPNHNGSNRAGEFYYLAAGLYDGSWNYIPKDLIMACWWDTMRRQSLDHFSGLGFRTLAAAYYDADDLVNPRNWLESLDTTPGACGIMYTTWGEKYGLLGPFGDLVSQPRKF